MKTNTLYIARRREYRRSELKKLLGSKCVFCNSIEDLEFDHIDPNTKCFDISVGIDKPWTQLLNEVSKCQLLCKPCHIIKTNVNMNGHGEGSQGKRGCKCVPCKMVKAKYMKEYSARYAKYRFR
jgi:hypothetical protein